jgi:trehalose 2-sulfotransferase
VAQPVIGQQLAEVLLAGTGPNVADLTGAASCALAGAPKRIPPQPEDEGAFRFDSDERLDFKRFAPLRRSYIIASSSRSGSSHLCLSLWRTGLLGAPAEYLNSGILLPILVNRLSASSHADYVVKLLARRTSRNGVFGMKAHFRHFKNFLVAYPKLLEVLSPVTYVEIGRQDKIAQAVSMAKALQTNQWRSWTPEGQKSALHYDHELIASCLKDLEQQEIDWRSWFEAYNITPFHVTYEDFIADPAAVVRDIVELLGVQDDERDQVNVPPALKQADETNQEWIDRFRRQMRGGTAARDYSAGGLENADAKDPVAIAHFFDKYHRLIERLPDGSKGDPRYRETIRLRHQYDAIVSPNRKLFQNARVLDITSSNGFWSMAALDAGAAHVVGVAPLIAAAEQNFADYQVKSDRYRFITSDIAAALEIFKPRQFDLILCKDYLERCHFPHFFHQLWRLRPKHVVLDTRVAQGHGPIARFEISVEHEITIISIPNHELIALLCEPHFLWNSIDWQIIATADRTSIHDYALGGRRTYLLSRR